MSKQTENEVEVKYTRTKSSYEPLYKDEEQSMEAFWWAVVLLIFCAIVFLMIFLLINPALQHQGR